MADTNREPTEDSTRESLIAISYGMPEAEQPAATSPKNKNMSNGKSGDIPGGNGDGDEKYRSKLISISCSPSPDMKAQPQPLLPVEHDA